MEPVKILLNALYDLANFGRFSDDTAEALDALGKGTFETSEEVISNRFKAVEDHVAEVDKRLNAVEDWRDEQNKPKTTATKGAK